MNIAFFVTAAGLGIGLAMDAFSVSLANGLHEPQMKWRRILLIAATFAGFQFLMPLTGWFCVHTAATYFSAFQPFIPYIALFLLLFIGGKMLIEGLRPRECKIIDNTGEDAKANDADNLSAATIDERGCVCCEGQRALGIGALLVQGIATSIDALSVGFTIADYSPWQALVACLVIGVLTFGICAAGVLIGKKFGTKLAEKASVFGGAILILIGIWIFVEGVFL